MTRGKTLLRPLEPAQRLASADRETLETIQAAVDACQSLVSEQGAALQKSMEQQLKVLKALVDAVSSLAERLKEQDSNGAEGHAELMKAVRSVLAAVAGLAVRLDEANVKSAAAVHADLAALNDTLNRIADTLADHDRRLAAAADAVPALSTSVETLRKETHDAMAERKEAQAGEARTLGDIASGTAALGRRFGHVEQALKRSRRDFWLTGVALPLLVGCAFFFGLMTDFVVRYLEAPPAVTAMLPAAELPPWPPPDLSLEIVTPE